MRGIGETIFKMGMELKHGNININIYILLIGLMGLAMRGSTAKVRSMARGCMYGVMDPSTWAYGSTIRSVGMECIHG